MCWVSKSYDNVFMGSEQKVLDGVILVYISIRSFIVNLYEHTLFERFMNKFSTLPLSETSFHTLKVFVDSQPQSYQEYMMEICSSWVFTYQILTQEYLLWKFQYETCPRADRSIAMPLVKNCLNLVHVYESL